MKIQVSFLRKHGFFSGWGRSGGISWSSGISAEKRGVGVETSISGYDGYLRLRYIQTDQRTGAKSSFDYTIPLTTTPCYFGGVRYWFLCHSERSGASCARRVGVLYKNGDYFACRHCSNITYFSKTLGSAKTLPDVKYLLLERKMEELAEITKRRFYAGKPTKKQRKLNRMYAEMHQVIYNLNTLHEKV